MTKRIPFSRKKRPPAEPAPVKWQRADPVALAAFDPASKVCTMNCGRAWGDPRNDIERRFLCDDCVEATP